MTDERETTSQIVAAMTKRIGLDFDGVLHSYKSGWTGPVPFDEPLLGAQSFVQGLIDLAYDVFIHTSRVVEDRDAGAMTAEVRETAIRDWLCHHGFPEDWARSCIITSAKLPAMLYVDDRVERFDPITPFAAPTEFARILEAVEKDGPLTDSWVHKEMR